MRIISKTIYLSSVFFSVYPTASFASLSSAYASLVDTSQNQTFESRPQAAAIPKRPVPSSFAGLVLQRQEPLKYYPKFANVKFIVGDGELDFGYTEFSTDDLCKQAGYVHNGCPAGYIRDDECPYDSKFVRDCIDPDIWCKNNGYHVTSCSVPEYPANPCPYKSSLYKSCETDNIRACKELGYSLTCEAGKVGDINQSCPYNDSYKKCICNPCSGYDYTAAQASAQGYVPGEVCNSCGTIKYKRTENACSGYKTCDCGGEAGAKVCYSGAVQKFDTCRSCCENKCTLASCPAGNTCEYESCSKKYCAVGCATGYLDLDNYWCGGALSCLVK